MQTTTATYSISVTTEEGTLSFLRTMPTRPKTQKGIKSQNNKLSKWVEKQYPNFTSEMLRSLVGSENVYKRQDVKLGYCFSTHFDNLL